MEKKTEKKSGIYCIENIKNGKQYIGKGVDVEKRMWQSHKGCRYIYNAIQKYGNIAFKRFVVEYCDIEKLIERENYYIEKWNTGVPNGYNLMAVGNGVIVHSDETKKLMRKNSRHFPNRKGKTVSEETKKKISESSSGEKSCHWGKRGKDCPTYGENNFNWGKRGKENPSFGKKSGKTSRYYGVYLSKGKYWCVGFYENAKSKYVGTYTSEINAARGYDKHVIENNLGRPLNFPDGIHPYWEI